MYKHQGLKRKDTKIFGYVQSMYEKNGVEPIRDQMHRSPLQSSDTKSSTEV